jgi:tetratricopeptide (TPR) repeat protein
MQGSDPIQRASDARALYAKSVQAFEERQFEIAAQLADQVVRLSGETPTAVAWAVRIRLESRRWQEAVDVGAPALARNSHPMLAGLLGHAYEELGRHEEAEQCFRFAAQGDKQNPTWHFHRAAALLALSNPFEAMLSLRTGVGLSPEPDAASRLSELELQFGGAERALEFAELALRARPDDPGRLALFARCLMHLGRFEEADTIWSRALGVATDEGALLMDRADALATCGEVGAAARTFREATLKDPRNVSAYSKLAALKRIGEEDLHLVQEMRELMNDELLEPQDRVALGYALGKALDNLGEYEAAMRCFDHANALEYEEIERAEGDLQGGFAANLGIRRNLLSRQLIERLKAEGDPTELPVFVLGMIRSGTTLAEQILSAHPLVAGAGEQPFWLNEDSRLIDMARQRVDERLLRADAAKYLKLLECFRGDAVRVVDKQPGNLTMVGVLHAAFPNARIVYMRRHPADTAISIWTTWMKTSVPFVHNKANIVRAYRECEKLMRHWQEVVPADRLLEVRYESLVTDRERVTRQMVEFCGLPWRDECLHPERNVRQVGTPSLWQVRQPVYESSIGRWRRYEPWLGGFRELLGD